MLQKIILIVLCSISSFVYGAAHGSAAGKELTLEDCFAVERVAFPGQKQEYEFIAVKHVQSDSSLRGAIGFAASPHALLTGMIKKEAAVATINRMRLGSENEEYFSFKPWEVETMREPLERAKASFVEDETHIQAAKQSSVVLYSFHSITLKEPAIDFGSRNRDLSDQDLFLPENLRWALADIQTLGWEKTDTEARLASLKRYAQVLCKESPSTHLVPVRVFNRAIWLAFLQQQLGGHAPYSQKPSSSSRSKED